MVHAPPPRSARRGNARDNVSTMSSDPRTRCDQRQVLQERLKEDTRTTIEQQREAHHQSDRHAGPAEYRPAPGDASDLPYAITCPAFTRELRQFQWPNTRTFKPEVPEKYDGKNYLSKFLSVYTIAMQAAGAWDDKILANLFPVGT